MVAKAHRRAWLIITASILPHDQLGALPGAERGTCVSFGDIFSSFLWTREADLVPASRSPLSSCLFLFVWLCWVFITLCGLSLLAVSYSSSQCMGLSRCAARTLGHTGRSTQAQQLRAPGSRAQVSSCGSGAQLLRGMWNLHRPGTESVSIRWATREVPFLAFCTLALSASLLQGSASSCSEGSISSCLDVGRLC